MIHLLLGLALGNGLVHDGSTYGTLTDLSLEVTVDGRIATGTARYVFEPLPSGYTFVAALPEGAAVSGLSARLDGIWIDAGAIPAQTQPPLPDGAPDQLLSGDVFSAVLPSGSLEPVEIALTWQAVLRAEEGLVQLEIPLSDGGLNPSDPVVSWSAEVMGHGSLDSFDGAPGTAVLDGGVGAVSGSAALSDLDALALAWTEPPPLFGIEVAVYRPALDPFTGQPDPDGYALVTVLPGPPDPSVRVDTLTTFVLDASASMAGRPMELAVAAAAEWLESLEPDDRFNLVPYTSVAVPFRGHAPRASDAAVERAIRFLERQRPAGLSDPTDGLVTGLGLADDTVNQRSFFSCGGTTGTEGPPVAGAEIGPTRGEAVIAAPYVVWLTDGGASSGEVDPEAITRAIAEANRVGASVYAVGVGDGVDRDLLERVAGANRGEVRYAERIKDVPEVVAALRDRIANPVLVHPSASIPRSTLQAPAALPDVSAGTELVFAFRYSEAGPSTLRLTGLQGQRDFSERYDLLLPSEDASNPAVARVWAQLRVRDLDVRYLAGDTGLYAEIEQLVRQYGVASDVVSVGFVDPYGLDNGADATYAMAAEKGAAGCGCATDRGLAGGLPLLALIGLISLRRRR